MSVSSGAHFTTLPSTTATSATNGFGLPYGSAATAAPFGITAPVMPSSVAAVPQQAAYQAMPRITSGSAFGVTAPPAPWNGANSATFAPFGMPSAARYTDPSASAVGAYAGGLPAQGPAQPKGWSNTGLLYQEQQPNNVYGVIPGAIPNTGNAPYFGAAAAAHPASQQLQFARPNIADDSRVRQQISSANSFAAPGDPAINPFAPFSSSPAFTPFSVGSPSLGNSMFATSSTIANGAQTFPAAAMQPMTAPMVVGNDAFAGSTNPFL